MFLVDHQDLEQPAMLCPFRNAAPCIGESCALWCRESNDDYSGCSVFITTSYAKQCSYYTRYPYHMRE